jgi:hypothetical protein
MRMTYYGALACAAIVAALCAYSLWTAFVVFSR